MKDVNFYMVTFMLLTMIGSLIGVAIYGGRVAPLITVGMLGGALIIVTVVWMVQTIREGV